MFKPGATITDASLLKRPHNHVRILNEDEREKVAAMWSRGATERHVNEKFSVAPGSMQMTREAVPEFDARLRKIEDTLTDVIEKKVVTMSLLGGKTTKKIYQAIPDSYGNYCYKEDNVSPQLRHVKTEVVRTAPDKDLMRFWLMAHKPEVYGRAQKIDLGVTPVETPEELERAMLDKLSQMDR